MYSQTRLYDAYQKRRTSLPYYHSRRGSALTSRLCGGALARVSIPRSILRLIILCFLLYCCVKFVLWANDEDDDASSAADNDNSLPLVGQRRVPPPGHGQRIFTKHVPVMSRNTNWPALVSELKRVLPYQDSEKLTQLSAKIPESDFKAYGERIRQLAPIINAWENLNILKNGGEYLVRKNVQATLLSHGLDTHLYEKAAEFIDTFGTTLFPFIRPRYSTLIDLKASFSGRGIVLSVGNHHAPYVLALIPHLREHLQCKLPIEIFYIGSNDLNQENREKLEKFDGVVTRDLTAYFDNEVLNLIGWAAKPGAILASSFTEVLFMDADVVFFQNPELLFTDPWYSKSGALFYLDRDMFPDSDKEKEWLQSILPQPYSDKVKQSRFWLKTAMHQQESGVVVVNKHLHFLAMLMVVHMNSKVRDEVTYKNVFGDKETFWTGFEIVGDTNYEFHPQLAGVMGPKKHYEASDSKTVCAPQLLHTDAQGLPMWFNGWIFENKFADKVVPNRFEVWTTEPGRWDLKKNNLCCLKNNKGVLNEFTKEEKATLDSIIQLWKKLN